MSLFPDEHRRSPLPLPRSSQYLRPSQSPLPEGIEQATFNPSLTEPTDPLIEGAFGRRPDAADIASEAKTRVWARVLGRRPVQLSVGLLLGSLLPSLFHWPSDGVAIVGAAGLTGPGMLNCLIGSAAAITMGWIMLRKLHAHPHVKSVGYVPYVFGMTYGVLAIVLLLLRAQYSRVELSISFLLTIAWFASVHWISGRALGVRMAVIPSRNMAPLPLSSKVRWLKLWEPHVDTAAIGALVADFRADHSPEWKKLMAKCALASVPVFDVRQVREQLTGRLHIGDFSEDSFGSTMHDQVYAEFKRALDILSVILLLPAFLPVIGISACLIALTSPGPVLFRQVRMGHRGRRFTMYKLRTMQHSASGTAFTVAADPRVTTVGRWLRKYHIDEFPQIWNILIGQMSWIGPRPETLELSEWYEREVPYYCYRHIVRPGVSGWAQVNQGNVGEVEAAIEKLQLDFYYIKHLSPWLDLLVAAKTLQAVGTGFGSH